MFCQVDVLGSTLAKSGNLASSAARFKAAAAVSVLAEAVGRGEAENSLLPVLGSACSPPRTSYFTRTHRSTTVSAPSMCLAPSKTRRKRRRRPDGGDSGGDDTGGPGDGGNWGGGDNNWGDGEESGPWKGATEGLWMWQILLLCSLIQAAHYLLTQRLQAKGQAQPRSAKFASLFSAASSRPNHTSAASLASDATMATCAA